MTMPLPAPQADVPVCQHIKLVPQIKVSLQIRKSGTAIDNILWSSGCTRSSLGMYPPAKSNSITTPLPQAPNPTHLQGLVPTYAPNQPPRKAAAMNDNSALCHQDEANACPHHMPADMHHNQGAYTGHTFLLAQLLWPKWTQRGFTMPPPLCFSFPFSFASKLSITRDPSLQLELIFNPAYVLGIVPSPCLGQSSATPPPLWCWNPKLKPHNAFTSS